MTSTRPPTKPPSPGSSPAPEPPSEDGASEIVLSAEEVHARATAELELFERVVKQISPRLHSQARTRLKSEADAEDAVQDVCSSGWNNDVVAKCASEVGRIIAYLTESMGHFLANEYRKRDRERVGIARYAAFLPTRAKAPATPDQDTLAREIEEQVDRALEELPAVYREAFNMVCRLGMSYSEAEAVLHIKVSTMRVYISKAKRHVGKRLRAAGYGPHSKAHAAKKERTP
jgi:RNA polymerase sigma factor (sigma-70 family)